MGKTSIGWTSSNGGKEEGYSFNPWWGCVEVGPDCNNCYARQLATRVGKADAWGKNGKRYATSEKNWNQVYKWNSAAEKAGRVDRVFTASMADIFENAMPVYHWNGEPMMFDHGKGDGPRQYQTSSLKARLVDLIDSTPNLEWLLLTKRPENIERGLPIRWNTHGVPRNVMFGMSAGDQKTFDKRIGYFYQLPVRKFLSLEPLFGPIHIGTSIMPSIDWVIVGGESGAKARPFHIKWAYDLLIEANDLGKPFFLKQLGSRPHGLYHPIQLSRGVQNHGENWDEWPDSLYDLKVREFPEIGAGQSRLL